MIKLQKNEKWYKYLELNKLILYDFSWKWWIWWKDLLSWEDVIFYWLKRKYLKSFNLSDPVEKQLSRINGFYEVLGSVYNDRLWMLYDSVYYDEEERVKEAKRIWKESWGKIDRILLEWDGDGIDQSAYNIVYDYVEDKIYYGYEDMDIKEEDKIEWTLTRKEFNLLMQIYFWIYDDEKIREELEEKERRWEYEEIKKYINDEMITKIFFNKEKELTEEEKRKMEEYLKLRLSQKPTDWAFEIKIEDYEEWIRWLEEQLKEKEYKKIKEEIEKIEEDTKQIKKKIEKIEKVKDKRKKALILYILNEIRKKYKRKVDDKVKELLKDITDWLIWEKEELWIELKDSYLGEKIEEAKTITKDVLEEKKEELWKIKKEQEKINYLIEKNKKILQKWEVEKIIFKKIYDRNWDEEEQKKVVEKINKELGKEVVILE